MKKIINIIMLLCPLLAYGQNYFETGTTWINDNVDEFSDKSYTETYYLTESEDASCLQMQCESSDYPGSRLICLIRTDGEKVFSKYPYQENEEWHLMYDFGLEPGQECEIWCGDNNYTVRCEKIIEEDPEYGGLATMVMSTYDEYLNQPIYGKWIKGIGGTRCVVLNPPKYYYSCELVEVKSEETIIFDRYDTEGFKTYFRAGTRWDIEYFNSDIEDLYSPIKNVYLRQLSVYPVSELIMEIYFLVDLDNNGEFALSKEYLGKVKTDGEKVYFKYPEQKAEEWWLMYDFGLKAGEECEVYCPYLPQEGGNAYRTRFLCKNIIESDPEYNGLTTMVMIDPTDKSGKEAKWIKGIGDTRGVIFNYAPDSFVIDTELKEVVDRNFKIVYDINNTSVSETWAEDALSVTADGNVLSIETTAAEGFVCDVNGCAVASFRVVDAPVKVTVPGKGIYVIKAGNSVRKVFVK